jgi:hypothetical protein
MNRVPLLGTLLNSRISFEMPSAHSTHLRSDLFKLHLGTPATLACADRESPIVIARAHSRVRGLRLVADDDETQAARASDQSSANGAFQ